MSFETLEKEIQQLRATLKSKEEELRVLKKDQVESNVGCDSDPKKLTSNEIVRYSRQIILPEITIEGQITLKNSSVLIVGAGGLGCPAASYLVAAGIGDICIADYDVVELSNLHRQLLHTEEDINVNKARSAVLSLEKINSEGVFSTFPYQLTADNAMKLVEDYDVVIDASDNPATRYLLNDACVLGRRPLVSGSALRFEGQLTVYNYDGGPCYRCVFPEPPRPETVTNCGDGGVLGVVPGVIGVLQALETIKIIIGLPDVLHKKMLIFDGTDTSFYKVDLGEKKQDCCICGENPTITELIDYEQFCGAKANDKDVSLNLLEDCDRITAQQYHEIQESNVPHMLIDVRPSVEYEMCRIDGSVNYPLNDLTEPEKLEDIRLKTEPSNPNFCVYTVCRRGNDSQKAVIKLKEFFSEIGIQVKDIKGGLHSWAKTVDKNFPLY